ncbi:MAG: 23S rRNA (pseudouridine(1915)-N(3))-methyltransferase RlmH [Lachnospiraceae bacterium]|jgi:23S rRNA (pseudouridine1915-N3)-methyltransferase|nr:23S rRNA (pseudouridine(1915)-N(3))-methyltransferase RlmH [Lachnospiraceae bacterium]
MNITILAVGKIKESFYREALAEYQKRLSRYCRLEIVEVADEPAPEKASPAQEDAIREKEAQRILKRLRDNSFVITLEIAGKKYDSEKFAKKLENLALSGKSQLVFIIGGSLGLHSSVSARADLSLSFSDMTFPHQLMRVILTEQIYRAFRIISGEPYHK